MRRSIVCASTVVVFVVSFLLPGEASADTQSGVELSIVAYPNGAGESTGPGDVLPSVDVGIRGVTADEIRIAPPNGSEYVNKSGDLTLEILAITGDGQSADMMLEVAPGEPVPVPASIKALLLAHSVPDLSAARFMAVGGDAAAFSRQGVKTKRSADVVLAPDPPPRTACSGWSDQNSNQRPQQTYVHLNTDAAAPATSTESLNATLKLGVALKVNAGRWEASGSMEASEKSGATDTTPTLKSDYELQNTVNYKLYKRTCVTPGRRPVVSLKWAPISIYDFNTKFVRTSHNYYVNCSMKAKGQSWGKSQGGTLTVGGGVKLDALHVDASSEWGSDHSLSWVAKEKSLYCGDARGGPVPSSNVEVHQYSSSACGSPTSEPPSADEVFQTDTKPC